MWMTHASEGLLIAYVDGEIEGSAAAELRDHLAACEACAGELHELERLSVRAHRLLGAADVAPPMLRARAAIGAARTVPARRGPGRLGLGHLGLGGLARAAGLVLVLAGVAAAVVPGSPVREVLSITFTRLAQFVQGEPEGAAVPSEAPTEAPAAAPEAMGMAIMPADGRVRVILHAPAGVVDVRVRLVDAARARVETTSDQPDMRLRSAAGRVEVMGLNAGELSIDIPRSVRAATVEVNGRAWVVKAGDQLQLAGPAGRDRGAEVRFRIGD
jgi:hypothetical protein